VADSTPIPIRHVLLDLDGTVYSDDQVLPETLPFLATLDELGIGSTFITNNTSRAVDDYVAKLSGLGIAVERDRILTPVAATAAHLQASEATWLYVLGTVALRSELAAAGFSIIATDDEVRPDAVVVGFDTGLDYVRLCRAAWWIQEGIPFLATHPDMVCPTEMPTVLVDCGAICAALTAATGRDPDAIFGKPDPSMIDVVVERTGVPAEEMAVIGDRLYTDMVLANRSGAHGILVLTGEATEAFVDALPPDAEQRPHVVCPTLAEVGAYLARES
jgi:NagD protein